MSNTGGVFSRERVRELLREGPSCPLEEIPADAADESSVFWRAYRKGMEWFSRRSRVPVEEVMGFLWGRAWDRAQKVSHKWTVAGEAGLVNCFSQILFEQYPDYAHHEREVPWDFSPAPLGGAV